MFVLEVNVVGELDRLALGQDESTDGGSSPAPASTWIHDAEVCGGGYCPIMAAILALSDGSVPDLVPHACATWLTWFAADANGLSYKSNTSEQDFGAGMLPRLAPC